MHLLGVVVQIHVARHRANGVLARDLLRAIGVGLAAEDAADLPGRVRGHLHARILHTREGREVVPEHGLDEVGVDPEALALAAEEAARLQDAVRVGVELRREEALRGADGIRGVDDDDVIGLVRGGLGEGEAVADLEVRLRVGEARVLLREELLRGLDDTAIDLAHCCLLHAAVLHDLTQNAPVATADDEDLLRALVGEHGQVRQHLLVGALVALAHLDHSVQDQNVTPGRRLENHDVLEVGLGVRKHLLHLQGVRLTRPLRVLLHEPAVFDQGRRIQRPLLGRHGRSRRT
mmetsp:Transcript_95667/g.274711  ORF Transcript_95667/g.274711 Transcript_95667/m.274711 type:complete len:291 (+) Transcript_95667:189-1061(+)